MKSSVTIIACLLISITSQAEDASESNDNPVVAGGVTLATDYRLRGISQTSGEPTVQGFMEVVFDTGLYAGAWASNLDFGNLDSSSLELDPYVGYGASISEEFGWDVIYTLYTFQGSDADLDYGEIMLNLYYKGLTLGYAYADDYSNLGKSADYLELNYSMDIGNNISLDLHAGYSSGNYWEKFDIGNHADYAIGLSTSLARLDFSLAYLFNDVDIDRIGEFDNSDLLLFSISRNF